MSGSRRITVALAIAVGASLPGAAAAQTYPSRQITLIIPFAAGGPSDTVGRITADYMSRTLGQQLIVENVAGAGGTLGAERAAKASPDGHTLFQHHSALPAAHSLYANLRYDTRTAFETIGLINTGPMVLTSRKNLEVKDARSLMEWLRERGDKATVAQAGMGSNSYLCALLLSQVSKAKFSMVPYAAPDRRCRISSPGRSTSCATRLRRQRRRSSPARSKPTPSPRGSACRP